MEQAVFEELRQGLESEGPGPTIDRLCAILRAEKDYSGLFYALLLKKRHELGVCPIPTGPSQELPESAHEPYENAIREAGRLVGQLFLDQGDIPRAWAYFHMLGEHEPVAKAIESFKPGQDEDIQQVIDIAYHQGVNPKRGFDLILERYGICNAITTVSSQELALPPAIREYCVKRLVVALHTELCERVEAEIARKEGRQPALHGVRELLAGRDWLFDDDFYHIDTSHLSAVVQLSVHLTPGPEVDLAMQLCEYGKNLSPRFLSPGDPPFENLYHDHLQFLSVLAGKAVETGLSHFRTKAEKADPENDGTRPAEVLVNLLLKARREKEALDVAQKYLASADPRMLICPSVSELCQRTGDFRALAEVARNQKDLVHFLAGLIASRQAERNGAAG
jgi:hypothetical protein